MTKEITKNLASEYTKESFIKYGIDYLAQPALSALLAESKQEFIEMILNSTSDKYQFILTIKELE